MKSALKRSQLSTGASQQPNPLSRVNPSEGGDTKSQVLSSLNRTAGLPETKTMEDGKMNGFKVTLLAAASALLLAAPAMAFHDGGVARCEGCHTMHNSLDGATMPNSTSTPGSNGTLFNVAGYLLQGNGSTSDACLVCHQ